MLKQKSLSVAIASALGVASAGMVTDAVYAADDETMIEEVFVTGSRIKRANVDSSSPVVVLDRQTLENKGITDVGYLLQRMPSMAGSPIGTTTNNGGNGSVQIDLRGLGAQRTLTLVNGKRTVDGGDYQTIPATMIDRVEILKDGASAVYGADAVAGVVNIITRSDYEGFKVEAYTSDFTDMDSGAQDSLNFITGKSFDGGNFMFGAEYVKQEEAFQSDAPWDYFQNSYYVYPAGCESQVTAPYDGTTSGGCYVIGSSSPPEGNLKFASQRSATGRGGNFQNSGNGLEPQQARYNYAPVNYIQTPYERINAFANVNYEVFEGVQLNAEMRYGSRTSSQELAPTPFFSTNDPAHSGVFEGSAYNGISEDNFYLTQAVDAYNLTAAGIADPLRYEPVVDARRRQHESPRRFENEVDQFQMNISFSGEIADINWDVFYNKGWRDRSDVDFGQFFGPNLQNALGPSADLNGDGTPECYTDLSDPTTLVQGCVPLNFFGGPFSVTQDQIDYVSVDLNDSFSQEQDQWGVNFSGESFELPGGTSGWAFGYEHREESFTYVPDSGKAQDAVTGNTGAGTDGSYKSDSFYGEVLLPVFDNGSQSFTVTGGYRWDDFSNFGSNSTYQLGMEFQVIETLKFRATAGEVFRAPGIGESFGGLSDGFPTATDPCGLTPLPAGCAQQIVQSDSQLRGKFGGNPNLEAESGDTVTFGIVWEPEFSFGALTLIVDYWKTELDDGIIGLGLNYILNDCHVDLNQNSCALITRRADYTIDSVLVAPLNAASSEAGGIDVDATFRFDNSLGEWEAAILWAHNNVQDRKAFATDTTADLVGTFDGNNMYAEDKISYSLDWSRGNWRAAYLGEYISEIDAPITASYFGADGVIGNPGEYAQTVDSQLYHDITVKYTHDSGVSLAVGLTNITDEEPPYIDTGFNANTDPSTYRLFGRGYYVRLAWEMGE